MNQSLNILMILHMPWNRNLGGSRVQLELAEEFSNLGHHVEKFDYYDAFPQAKSSRLAELTRPSFAVKAKAFVQANARHFDIIDAHQGNLPFTKQELGFQGLLVARSVGLYAFYEEFVKLARTQYPPKTIKAHLRNWLSSWHERRESPLYQRSLETCDLINVPNHDELAYVRNTLELGDKCVVLPFGLSQQQQQKLAETVCSTRRRLAHKQVAFIGSWGLRKGSKDWAEIIQQVKQQVPDVHFLFLGTGFGAEKVLEDIQCMACDWIKIIPHYDNKELPKLLGGATVGAFPSYIEGFGFAVLEKLACGLPTVAYDAPGAREMLRHLDGSFLTPVGDIEKFSSKLVNLLLIDDDSYSHISQCSVTVAQKFYWSEIAKNTLNIYTRLLRQHVHTSSFTQA